MCWGSGSGAQPRCTGQDGGLATRVFPLACSQGARSCETGVERSVWRESLDHRIVMGPQSHQDRERTETICFTPRCEAGQARGDQLQLLGRR